MIDSRDHLCPFLFGNNVLVLCRGVACAWFVAEKKKCAVYIASQEIEKLPNSGFLPFDMDVAAQHILLSRK